MWRNLLGQMHNWRGRAAAARAAAGDVSAVMIALDSSANTWLFRVPRTRPAIADFCAMVERRLPPGYAGVEVLRAFQVAFDELLTNIATHVGAPAEQPIEVLLQREPERIVALIRYRGARFDPTAQPQADTSSALAEREIGGLGLHLVRALMDEFRHIYVAGFNELTLVKRC